MEISTKQIGPYLELKISGRLDAYWSDHLSTSIETAMRQGSHLLQLNLADVPYLSSAGIRVLLKYFKQLKEIKGRLSITHPSESALSILELAGLTDLLVDTGASAPPLPVPVPEPVRIDQETTVYYVHEEAPGSVLKGRMIGVPEKINTASFTAADSHSETFPDGTFGLGMGAIGPNFEECRNLFGEFLAAAGVAAYLPSGSNNVPDYVVSEGLLVPQLELLYGISWHGRFSHLIRFEAKSDFPGVTKLSEIVEQALQSTRASTAGFVILAESAGLVGASLKQSPVEGSGTSDPLGFPEIRDWVSFSAERCFDRNLCVIVGIASRSAEGPFKPMLRPLGKSVQAVGHFHAAVFPYHPLQRGQIELFKSLTGLFGVETIQGLIHLLADDREIEGIGESEFLRGACWVGALEPA